MFILCFFFLNGILVFTSGGGNRALSGRATGGETIHRSLRSGAQTSRKSPSLLNFLSVGAMSHRFVQIPYRNISGEAVLQSPISARNFASNGATSWSLNSFGFRFSSKKCTVKSFKNSSCVPTDNISASGYGCISCVKSTRLSAAFAMAASPWTDLPTPHLNIHLKKVGQSLCGCPDFQYFSIPLSLNMIVYSCQFYEFTAFQQLGRRQQQRTAVIALAADEQFLVVTVRFGNAGCQHRQL